jgi:hypothetical protein
MVPKKRGFREVGVSDREGDRMVAEGKLSKLLSVDRRQVADGAQGLSPG